MKQAQSHHTFQQRKDTFLRRGRFRWPYIKYTSYLAQPETLASAGFVFSPAKDAPDNVQCFHCGFELTGWEPTDDPFAEHFAHEPSCAYAQLHCQTRRAARGNKIELTGWPYESAKDLDEAQRGAERARVVAVRDAVEMRQKTFGEWPHGGLDGWTVTPEKLAAAGFYFTPEFPGDDTATCAFCGYALGDWEADDEPMEEHSKRSPDCLFFRLDRAAEDDVESELADSEYEPESAEAPVEPAESVDKPAEPVEEEEEEAEPTEQTEAPEHDTPPASSSSPEGKRRNGTESVVIDSDAESEASTTSKRQRLSAANSIAAHRSPAPRTIGIESTDHAQPPPIASESEPTVASPPNGSTQQTQVDSAPASPGTMAIDEIAVDATTQQSTQVEGAADEWDLDEEEEEMTVEEFIRACCDQKIAALEASASHMVDTFMKRAESTRERICNLTW
ncbi:hypothetical protein H4S01_001843 [Coemansia sp. RSA 2610]|nr:hypothetical protein H4S01_001843 [Coemansia sp. RSA 2610]